MQIKSAGFTLVEILVISPIIILFIGTFISLLVTLTGESLVVRERNVAIYDSQAALDEMQASITQATGFLEETTNLQSPQGKDNATAKFTDKTATLPDTLIVKLAATTKSPNDSTRELIYTGAGACDSKNPIYNYYAIYFVDLDPDTTGDLTDKALFKRTILPQSAACAAPWQRGSCAASYKTITPTPTVCKRSDEKLVGGIATLDVKYHVGNTAGTDSGAATATDVTINLSVAKKIAGSDVNYSSSARGTSLNIQSADAGVVTPTNPAITWTRDANNPSPYRTTISWSRIGNATGYRAKYLLAGVESTVNINQTAATSYSFPIDAVHRKQTVQLTELKVLTSAGEMDYGPMPAGGIPAIPRWNDCSMPSGGWQNYGAPYNDMGFTKTSRGAVGLKGLVRYGTVGFDKNTRVCTLPEGFRPQDHLIFYAVSHETTTGAGVARVDIWPDGALVITATPGNGNLWVSMDGIIYMTASGNPTWTTASLIAPWVFDSYGGDTYAPPKYYRDTAGRAWVQGLASGGQPNYRIFYMNANMAPQYGNLHMPANSVNRGSAVNINSTPDIVGRPDSGSWVSTQFLYYATGGLRALPLNGTWVNYGGTWSTAQCFKGDDDIVILQGLVRAGAASGTMAGIHNCGGAYGSGLPPPSAMSTGRHAILPAWNNPNVPGRVDLSTDYYLYPIVTDSGWTSLDGVHYIAD